MTRVDDIVLKKRREIAVLKGFDFSTVQETASRVKRHPSLISHMALDGKIKGAIKFGNRWMIPNNWKLKPKYRGKAKVKEKEELLSLKDPSKKV